MSKEGSEISIQSPDYKFIDPSTLLFLTGVPLSGKSTIAPLLAASISSCVLQPMDIIRLAAQEVENTKPIKKRNPFVFLGSCDGYIAIGDGTYSDEALIEGFNAYSNAVCALIINMIPKLEVQGAQNVLFEGVQLTPSIVKPHLRNNNKLVVVASTEKQLESNRNKLFGGDSGLNERYSIKKLMLLQDEILRQSAILPNNQLLVINNIANYVDAATDIMHFLLDEKVIDENSEAAKS